MSRQLFTDMPVAECVRSECSCYNEHGDEFNCSDILDLDSISSSGNSCEEEVYDKSSLINSPSGGSLYGSAVNDLMMEGRAQAAAAIPAEFPNSFVHWVEYGATLA
uniref:Uncharacterized protein n=3 Tax=Opuntia streptacantha TaxID=393608 RepID=A0A7C8ZLH7_OPUST